jgi:hypothetical protein
MISVGARRIPVAAKPPVTTDGLGSITVGVGNILGESLGQFTSDHVRHLRRHHGRRSTRQSPPSAHARQRSHVPVVSVGRSRLDHRDVYVDQQQLEPIAYSKGGARPRRAGHPKRMNDANKENAPAATQNRATRANCQSARADRGACSPWPANAGPAHRASIRIARSRHAGARGGTGEMV